MDDEVPIRRLLARLLEKRGFDVYEAASGDAALAIVRERPVSVVLCDVRMPGMNGVDLYRELIATHPGLARSFVFITGDKSTVKIAGDLRAGVQSGQKHYRPDTIEIRFVEKCFHKSNCRSGT